MRPQRQLDSREKAKRTMEKLWQDQEKTLYLRVNGNSMGDSLPHGSTIEVKFSHHPRLRRGGLVYFRRGNLRICHRVLFAFGPLCIEKGDANRYPHMCFRNSILGVARLVVLK